MHNEIIFLQFQSCIRNIIEVSGGLMVSAFDSGASASGSSPGQGHCVVFLGKTLYSHSASLGTGKLNAGG